MDNRQMRTYHVLLSVRALLDTPTVGPQPPLFAKMRTSLGESITRIRELQTSQTTSTPRREPGGITTDHLRTKIRRERMMPLVKVAKPLLKFAPGTVAALRVPHARASAAEVAASAIKLSDVLKPHARLLASAGYGKDFVAAMREEAALLAATLKRNERLRNQRSGATSGMAAEFRKALGAITVIEGILAPRLNTDEVFRAKWHVARRITARLGRPRQRKQQQLLA
jgi:hypothetical protein